MGPTRATARFVGVLFIVATAAASLSQVLVGSLFDDANYLVEFAADEDLVGIGVLLDLITAAAVVGIGVALFPVLRPRHEGLAAGYAGFRIVEGAVIVAGAITSLLVLSLSQDFVASTAPETAGFDTTGRLLLAARDWTDVIATQLFFGITAVILNCSLYLSGLVPRFISVWGLVGSLLGLTGGVLGVFGLDPFSTLSVVLFLPIAVNEMVLALWLIIRGFTTTSIPPDSAQRNTPPLAAATSIGRQ